MQQLHLITDLHELMGSRQQWNQVAVHCPLHSWEWMSEWSRHLGSDLELSVLVAKDHEGNWKGIAPLCIELTKTLSKKIRFIGSGNACTDYATLICADCDRAQFAELIADWFIQDSGYDSDAEAVAYDLIELEGVTEDDPILEILKQRLTEARFSIYETELEGSWVVSLPETWGEFHKSFSKSMRRKTKEAAKRLDAESTTIVSSRDGDFDSIWKTFCDLHQQRRAMMGQDGCFSCVRFESFLYNATRQLAGQDLAEITVIQSNDQALASMLTFIKGETLMMYQSGFNPKRQNESPGYQIVLQAVRNAFERGLSEFDLMRGDEPYKARWNTSRVPLKSLRLVPPRFSALVRQNLWMSAKSIKEAVSRFGMLAK